MADYFWCSSDGSIYIADTDNLSVVPEIETSSDDMPEKVEEGVL